MRAWITGLGMVTPLGLNTPTNWEAQLAGKSGISKIHQFDTTRHDVKIAGQILPDFWENPKTYLPDIRVPSRNVNVHKDSRRMHRVTQLGVMAAHEAITQSGLEITDSNRKRVGVYVGTGGGGANEYIDATRTLDDPKAGPNRVDPILSVRVMPNATAGMISKIFGAHGPSLVIAAACATGNEAARLGLQELERGRCDAMIVVGAEAALDPIVIAAFGNLHALTSNFNDCPERASRPFDRDRSGFVWSDAAVAWVIETEESARARGAEPLGYLLGAYATDDAFHETRPTDDAMGSQDAMRGALEEAGLNPTDVDLISLHGTSTPENDIKETLAVNGVFGPELASTIMAEAAKSRGGHMIGASGLFSASNAVLQLRHKVVLPTLNLDHQDPACNLNLAKEPRELKQARKAVINNAGFGGHNSVLVVAAV